MSESENRILEAVVEWHLLAYEILASTGVEVVLSGPTSGRNKESVVLEIVSSNQLVALTIWDSGEYEVNSAPVSNASDPIVEVGELTDATGVTGLLDRVVSRSVPSAGSDG
ncbi:hypothetical protein [Leifsonia xyli]|uniref:hypothetical protein n=1 Tax=Leifsonia xyli TaxID=1575 RepID=UPI0012DF0F06|nr:hypothetical protein [Leifsonia xyli]